MRLTYDKKSPATGLKTVLVEPAPEYDDFLEICMDTGYQSYTKTMMITNAKVNEIEKQLHSKIVHYRISDGDRFWYKIPMIDGDYILYPHFESLYAKDFQTAWCVSKLVPAGEDYDGFKVPIIQGEDNRIIGWLKPDEQDVQVFDVPTQLDEVGDLLDSSFLQGFTKFTQLVKSIEA